MYPPPPALRWLAPIAMLLPAPALAASGDGGWNLQLDLGTTLLSRSPISGSDLRLAHAQALAASLHRRWTGPEQAKNRRLDPMDVSERASCLRRTCPIVPHRRAGDRLQGGG